MYSLNEALFVILQRPPPVINIFLARILFFSRRMLFESFKYMAARMPLAPPPTITVLYNFIVSTFKIRFLLYYLFINKILKIVYNIDINSLKRIHDVKIIQLKKLGG